LESRESRDNPKADWYVWVDPQPDGTPPNNWLSIFGGCAWEWEPRRCQYYLHNFLKSQPDLNFHCEAVRQQVLDEVEFWLERGVDGLRLDAINFCFHDQQLRSNPSKPAAERKGRGFKEDNPYAFQKHLYNNTRPENIAFLESLRALMDRYPGTVTLGEISAEDSLKTMAEYTAGNKRLHMAYSFELLVDKLSGSYIRETVETLEQNLSEGWPCWSIGNHDVMRVMSRWGGEKPSPLLAKTLNRMLMSLRGSVCTYQGEELGLTEAVINQQELQDPYGIAFWPRFKGRDGCRTPMPWVSTAAHGGFSKVATWLPVSPAHLPMAVDKQEVQKNSVLNSYRRFSQWRKQQPALLWGSICFISATESTLVFARSYEQQTIILAFNLSETQVAIPLKDVGKMAIVDIDGQSELTLENNILRVPPYESAVVEVIEALAVV
jgi:alpha-glucosidase